MFSEQSDLFGWLSPIRCTIYAGNTFWFWALELCVAFDIVDHAALTDSREHRVVCVAPYQAGLSNWMTQQDWCF